MIALKINMVTTQQLTDTDSLMYEIKTDDVYKDFSKDKAMFGFSNYSVKLKYYDDSNNLVVGEMKDETGDTAIEEFVGLSERSFRFWQMLVV